VNLETEQRLLRFAISRGFLRWDDLESVADRLPTPDDPTEPSMSAAGWFQVLLNAGRIDLDTVALLASELPDGPQRLALGPKRHPLPARTVLPAWEGSNWSARLPPRRPS
jgi:hypothetical protein